MSYLQLIVKAGRYGIRNIERIYVLNILFVNSCSNINKLKKQCKHKPNTYVALYFWSRISQYLETQQWEDIKLSLNCI